MLLAVGSKHSFLFAIFKFGFGLLFLIVLGITASSADPGTSHYQIGPTDILQIYVWKEPELTRDISVMPDGNITFPLIGEIQAEGKTVDELKKIITEKLGNYVTAPEVTVIVVESRSRRVYTLGKLNRPGPYPLQPDMTVLQVLSTAGGFAEWADEKNIWIIRREGRKEVQMRFNYKEYISGDNVEQNILLKPNDTIVVP
jgi:polysaccharide export outer membrane protein